MLRLILLSLTLLLPALPVIGHPGACAPTATAPMMTAMSGSECCSRSKPTVSTGCCALAEKPTSLGTMAPCMCDTGSSPIAPSPTPTTLRGTLPTFIAAPPRMDALTDAWIARASPAGAVRPVPLIGSWSNQDRRALVGVWRT